MRKRVLSMVALLLLVLMISSCAMLSKFIITWYPVSFNAADCLARGTVEFNDVSLEDRWGLTWYGLFWTWYRESGQDEDINMVAVREGLGVSVTQFESYYNKSSGTTTYSYHVEKKEDLQKLADIALDLIFEWYEDDPEVAMELLEDFYGQIAKSEGRHYQYALMPYLDKIAIEAAVLLEYDIVKSAPETLTDDTLGARAAKHYLEKFPAGFFVDIAKARQSVTSNTQAELVL